MVFNEATQLRECADAAKGISIASLTSVATGPIVKHILAKMPWHFSAWPVTGGAGTLRCVKGQVAAHAGAGAVGSHNSEMISMVCS